jgi:hypothetical protein
VIGCFVRVGRSGSGPTNLSSYLIFLTVFFVGASIATAWYRLRWQRGSSCGKRSHFPNPMTLCIPPARAVALQCGSFASSPTSRTSKGKRSNARVAATALTKLLRLGDWTYRPNASNVRFGSEADMCVSTSDVRFTPNSDRESGHPQRVISGYCNRRARCFSQNYRKKSRAAK